MTRARDGEVVMLISHSETPCGVEMFARGLARAAATRSLAVDGRLADAANLWRGLAAARALVVNLPVVAWKRALLTPLLALLIARLRGARAIVVLHEWSDLRPARRAVYSIYLMLAEEVVFSSPYVRDGFLGGRAAEPTAVIPIPPNIAAPRTRRATPASAWCDAQRTRGRLVLGHFGSIYPKKRSEFVLEVAAALRARGRETCVVCVGGFVEGGDCEARFFRRAAQLGLADSVLVTGYLRTEEEIFAAFDRCDAFVYAFAEGLTSRRGSVLACLQSGKPVVVDAPLSPREFDHHPVYRERIAAGALNFVAIGAPAETHARAVEEALARPATPARELFAKAWGDAAAALKAIIGGDGVALEACSGEPAGNRARP